MGTKATSIDAFASASAHLEQLRDGGVGSEELLDLYLERTTRFNPALNAIVTPNEEAARTRARAADRERAAGKAVGALHGLPITLKDSYQVAGLRWTAGIDHLADNVPGEDGQVAKSLFHHGAVLMGKTNIPPYLGDWQSTNSIFGRTVNPWDHTRTPGGSSGGSAAAVAAGLTALDLGSDIGGSIRIPAAFCGIYGHKPSETAVPRSGSMPPDGAPIPAMVMGVQGPMGRSAGDLELALDVIAGPEIGEDTGAWRLELPPARHERLEDFRVAVMPPIDWLPVDESVSAGMERVVSAASRAGATVQVAAPAGLESRHHAETYRSLLNVMVFNAMPPKQRETVAREMRESDDELGEASARGVLAGIPELFHWLGERERYRAAYREFFRDWDVLVAPIALGPAFEHDDRPFQERTLTINGKTVRYDRQFIYPGLATFAGQPATAFPAGKSDEGLPIGLQVIGPYLDDRTPIRFAELLEREMGGFEPPPGY